MCSLDIQSLVSFEIYVLSSMSDFGGAVFVGCAYQLIYVVRCVGFEGMGLFKLKI